MESKFKKGDVVTIKRRIGNAADYRFLFTGAMADLAGKSFEIEHVSSYPFADTKRFPDDGFQYVLKGLHFFWASSMFEDSPKESSKKDEENFKDIVIFTKKKKYIQFNFNI